jgi:DNA-binding NtrC family response regulator
VDRDNVVRIPVGTPLEAAERKLIRATLDHCAGNKNRAAEILGISLKTLYNRLNAYRDAAAPPAGIANADPDDVIVT